VNEPSLDQQLALKTAARNLRDEFEGTFGVETIELFLNSSYDQFAGRAKVATFLPLLAERFAKQRLKALARVEGKGDDGLPIVLFLCVHNAGRSQMALGWFNHLAGGRALAWSGGSEPGNEVNPSAVAAMAEVGIDIAKEFPKPWTEEIAQLVLEDLAQGLVAGECVDHLELLGGLEPGQLLLGEVGDHLVEGEVASPPLGAARPRRTPARRARGRAGRRRRRRRPSGARRAGPRSPWPRCSRPCG
jgi:hypothetical protein